MNYILTKIFMPLASFKNYNIELIDSYRVLVQWLLVHQMGVYIFPVYIVQITLFNPKLQQYIYVKSQIRLHFKLSICLKNNSFKAIYVCLTKTITAQIMVKCNIVHGLLVRDQSYIILNYAVIEQ